VNPGEPRIKVEKRDGIGHLIFDNPARRNAITLGMWQAIPLILDDLATDKDIRVIMLRGAGKVAFISGADISEFDDLRSDTQGLSLYDTAARVAQERLYDFGKPTVAAIMGFCFGAGVSLAVCCDIRIAASTARFSIPAGKLGLGYRAAGIRKLIDLVGPARTLDLFYTAGVWSAENAITMGLVEHVVSEEAFGTFAEDYCLQAAELAPLTLGAVKVAVREIMRAGDAYDHERCESLALACYTSEDYAEGRAAFREKRKPIFQGR
jgi:enoyl-CoA hydratase/carnithine racemase